MCSLQQWSLFNSLNGNFFFFPIVFRSVVCEGFRHDFDLVFNRNVRFRCLFSLCYFPAWPLVRVTVRHLKISQLIWKCVVLESFFLVISQLRQFRFIDLKAKQISQFFFLPYHLIIFRMSLNHKFMQNSMPKLLMSNSHEYKCIY